MEPLDNYNIKHIRLKTGVHNFVFHPGDAFFENFEYSFIKKCKSTVHVTLTKQKDRFFTMDFAIEGAVELTCDRCLDTFQYPVSAKHRLIFKIQPDVTEETETDDAELIFLPTESESVNIAQYLYEFINLTIPIKKTCDDTGKNCNPDVIKVLNKHKAESKKTDPRWDDLKKFYKN